MRKLLLLSILLFIPLAQAKDKQPLTLQADLIITGEIVQEGCSTDLPKSKQASAQQIIRTLSDNCTINESTGYPVPRVRVTAFTPIMKNQTSESADMLKRYSFFLSEYI